MSWWSILKNARLSSKVALDGKLKDGDIKISFDEKCKKKLRKFNLNALKINQKSSMSERADRLHKWTNNIKVINMLPEKVACEALKQIEALDIEYLPSSIGGGEGKYRDFVKPLIDGEEWNIAFHLGKILNELFFACEIFKQSRYSGIILEVVYVGEISDLQIKDIDWRK
jgi:hypothetical protein